MPEKIAVQRREVAELFEPVAKFPGIKIELTDYLEVLENLKGMMVNFI